MKSSATTTMAILPLLLAICSLLLTENTVSSFTVTLNTNNGPITNSPFLTSTMVSRNSQNIRSRLASSSSTSSAEDPIPEPTTFREAEILGLRLMQESQHQQALEVFRKGLKLPGSRTDIIRTKTLSGPSPVGGSSGGTEGKRVQTLDEFEMQAAHYNIACACSQLGKYSESVKSLEQAFQAGFDNYATVRADPDLSGTHGTSEFEMLMEKYDPKKGFPNPFAFFS